MGNGIKLRRAVIVALALAALAFQGGCGKKAPPFIPVRATETFFEYVRANRVRGGILVSWREAASLPAPPTGLTWAVYSLERRAEGEPYKEIKSAKVTGQGGGGRYEYLDLQLEPGREYRYQLRLFTQDRRAGYSHPELVVTAEGGPAPPALIEAEAGDGQVSLAWAESKGLPPGKSAGGYNLFRAEGDGRINPASPLNPQPITGTSYLDTSAANGRRYCYAVTVVVAGDSGSDESAPGTAVCATPQDRTPPGPPVGLRVSPGAGYVLLAWAENGERDLAGYRVYRKTGDGAFRLLTPEPVRASLFKDDRIEPGSTYAYAVTAVDTSPLVNESPYSPVVEITLPQ
jgi:hypothetical protein